MDMDGQNDSLVEEITLFIEYGVPQAQRQQAEELLGKYKQNLLLLRLLREYYATLPEALEEPAIKISKLMQKEGVYLFVLSTPTMSYLYVVSAEDVLWLGNYQEEVSNEIINFFEFSSQSSFLKQCPGIEELEAFPEDGKKEHLGCPVCGVEEHDYHLLGCIVEVCPWCGGQLSSCSCRFEQLETEEIDSEELLQDFVDVLEEKGRIPYTRGQEPAYPGTSKGLDR